MLKFIYSVYDQKSKVFGNPFISNNRATAERDFGYACNDVHSQISKWPADFTLYEIGSFEDTTCKIELNSPPEIVGHGIQYKEE